MSFGNSIGRGDAPMRLYQICRCCDPSQSEFRERRRLLDLAALLEHPDALPADLRLRLGMELLALTAGLDRRFVCDAIGDLRS
ncbi:hypothetical protein [Xanthobacter sp. VNH20]|uniref:hypothetical protein n=1 Tax=Xanthobacter sp. VNH20 TaxID=3156616 RepID=UPI0032B51E2F